MLEQKTPTFYIRGESDITSLEEITHFSLNEKRVVTSKNWFPKQENPTIAFTAGASCPDALVDKVIRKLSQLSGSEVSLEQAAASYV